MSKRLEAAIAANRFGLGARPGDLARIGSDPRGWLLAQLSSPAAFRLEAEGLLSSTEAAKLLQAYRSERRAAQEETGATSLDPEAQSMLRRAVRDVSGIAVGEGGARTQHALSTETPFAERLVWFWANHFTVAATKLQTLPFAGAHEREAIRAGMTGTFEDLLLASTRHAGMLLYLDQAQSAGPNSAAGRRRDAGLNENLAREILELQTLGAQGGYTQGDVTEFAKALTGWTVSSPRLARLSRNAPPGTFVFAEPMHEPGARTVLAKRYPEGGREQAEAILKDLARHPATARRISEKLARHFIRDEPPEGAVATLERTFRDTGGSLPELHRALVALAPAWSAEPAKFKTPNEFLVSSLRLAGIPRAEPRALAAGYALLGQAPYRAPSPEGWPDDAESWAGPDAVMKRLEWAQSFADRVGADRGRPAELIEAGLGPLLSERTRLAVERAESGSQGLTLALMSPEFQRR